eukprot:superscaffoldBa00002517_g14530
MACRCRDAVLQERGASPFNAGAPLIPALFHLPVSSGLSAPSLISFILLSLAHAFLRDETLARGFEEAASRHGRKQIEVSCGERRESVPVQVVNRRELLVWKAASQGRRAARSSRPSAVAGWEGRRTPCAPAQACREAIWTRETHAEYLARPGAQL